MSASVKRSAATISQQVAPKMRNAWRVIARRSASLFSGNTRARLRSASRRLPGMSACATEPKPCPKRRTRANGIPSTPRRAARKNAYSMRCWTGASFIGRERKEYNADFQMGPAR